MNGSILKVHSDSMEIIESQRGGLSLIVDSMKYALHHRQKSSITWRCRNKQCKAVVFTDAGMKFITRRLNDHNHQELSFHDIELLKTRNSIKKKADDGPPGGASNIVCRETAEMETPLGSRDRINLSNAFYRRRARSRSIQTSSRPSHVENIKQENLVSCAF